MIKRALATFVIVSVLIPTLVLGATDEFTIGLDVTGPPDVDPPTTPANLVATPVATTQIDLTWDASTDNTAVTGYQVFRDSVQVATATGVSYSDVGLTASTTYTYEVAAFDAALNISTTSSSTSATTLQAPTSTPGGGATTTEESGGITISGGIPTDLNIVSIEVLPGVDSAIIRWETSVVTRSVVLWGETPSYETGSLQERSFDDEHEAVITGLKPGTTYYYTIRATNYFGGGETTLIRQVFTTVSVPDKVPPANVSGLIAGIEGDDIVVSWTNPHDDDFSHIRVIRNDTFYPGDPNDGWLVYEGTNSLVRDESAARGSGTKYYTVFAYDKNGNISSGAIIKVTHGGGVQVPAADPEETVTEKLFQFPDLIFSHGPDRLTSANNRVRVAAEQQLTVALPYDLLPEHLKTITITLTDPEYSNRTFSFLLRINEGKTAYEATIAPLRRAGNYPVQVDIFDFTLETLTTVDGTIEADIVYDVFRTEEVQYGLLATIARIIAGYPNTVLLLIILLLLIARWCIGAGRRYSANKGQFAR